MQRIEATTWELWQWRIAKTFRVILFYFIAWPVFLASIPATIYMGYVLIGDILTGIRDWWHYKESLPSENSWMGLGIIVTGLIWIVGMSWADSPVKDETTRFNEFIQQTRSANEYAQKEREMPKTLLGKIWHYTVLTYGVLMLCMLAALAVKELFF
jgi:hypothetical protein